MRRYYRALPQHTKGAPDAFKWVPDIKDATKDYRPSVETTQGNLKRDYSIDTVLVPVQDAKYVLASDVDADPVRLKNQTIEPGQGITTHADEVLTDPEPGKTTFEGVHEVLDPDEK
jgi:hypothetical protein